MQFATEGGNREDSFKTQTKRCPHSKKSEGIFISREVSQDLKSEFHGEELIVIKELGLHPGVIKANLCITKCGFKSNPQS